MSSRLLDELPAIFRADPFLGNYLLAFEKVLNGLGDGLAPTRGLEQSIARLPTLFDPDPAAAPDNTPAEFLPWLAQWVALTLRADLPEATQRAFLSNMVQRYQRRGTKRNLIELLQIFTQSTSSVSEDPAQPFKFTVTLGLVRDPKAFGTGTSFVQRQIAIAGSLIELEKPAHTTFDLNPVYPSFQVGVNSTVGVDTLIGADPSTLPAAPAAPAVAGASASTATMTSTTTPTGSTKGP